jgi:hypothetical protein
MMRGPLPRMITLRDLSRRDHNESAVTKKINRRVILYAMIGQRSAAPAEPTPG